MAKDSRFVRTYSQNSFTSENEIWMDTVTGVNYFYHTKGYSGGLTPLLDRDGRPIITATGTKPE